MPDDDVVRDRRLLDPHISDLQRDVALLRQGFDTLNDRFGDMQAQQRDIGLDVRRIASDANDPTLTAAGRELANRSITNRQFIEGIQHRLDDRPGGLFARLDDIEDWRAQLRGAFRLVQVAVGVSVLSAAVSILTIAKLVLDGGGR